MTTDKPLNIAMFTNTFLPHVGGVAKSVILFAEAFRARGHRVLIVAPEFPNTPENEKDVVRITAIQNFNGSDFSVVIPIPWTLSDALDDFRPDILHAHHPYLLGDSALRAAAAYRVPLVFTHHTMYERYTHYVPGNSPIMRRFAIELGTRFANRCGLVFAPSQTVKDVLVKRGVIAEIDVVPTGVPIQEYRNGNGPAFREKWRIPADAFLAGHLGRLAAEKNLEFLAKSVARFLVETPEAWFLLVGSGPSQEMVIEVFAAAGVSERVVATGSLTGQDVVDAYHAMNVFAFASRSETQGMVIAEAMAAAVPVVALDASGVRDVLRDHQNGLMLMNEDEREFADALQSIARMSIGERKRMNREALKTAESFSVDRMAELALSYYRKAIAEAGKAESRSFDDDAWSSFLRVLEEEWLLIANRVSAAAEAVFGDPPAESELAEP